MMEVHPLANVFPMMTDDELQDLADDIKEHGLLHPIVLDADGVLIDGRNRLRACEIAGREPQFERLNGHDAAAFIVSANLERRNLTKGQQAMALAMIYPITRQGKRTEGSATALSVSNKVSTARLSQARSVLRHSQALAESVMARHISLDDALETVAEARRASQSTDAKMAELRAEAPDLADLVDEERLPLDEAHATLVERRNHAARSEANKRENMLRLSEAAWHAITAWASEEFVAELSERLDDTEFRRQWLARVRLDPMRINDILVGAKAFALVVKDQSSV
jgi:hypothetical protein